MAATMPSDIGSVANNLLGADIKINTFLLEGIDFILLATKDLVSESDEFSSTLAKSIIANISKNESSHKGAGEALNSLMTDSLDRETFVSKRLAGILLLFSPTDKSDKPIRATSALKSKISALHVSNTQISGVSPSSRDIKENINPNSQESIEAISSSEDTSKVTPSARQILSRRPPLPTSATNKFNLDKDALNQKLNAFPTDLKRFEMMCRKHQKSQPTIGYSAKEEIKIQHTLYLDQDTD